MSQTENTDKVVIDSQKADIRAVGGVHVQSIPARWRRLLAFADWFKGDLDIKLCIIDGQKCVVIERAEKRDLDEPENTV